MSIDLRHHRLAAAEPYRLLLVIINRPHPYGFSSPLSDYYSRRAHMFSAVFDAEQVATR